MLIGLVVLFLLNFQVKDAVFVRCSVDVSERTSLFAKNIFDDRLNI